MTFAEFTFTERAMGTKQQFQFAESEWAAAAAYFNSNPDAIKYSRKRAVNRQITHSFWKINGVIYVSTHAPKHNVYKKPYGLNNEFWRNTIKELVDKSGNKKILKIQTIDWEETAGYNPCKIEYSRKQLSAYLQTAAGLHEIQCDIAHDLGLTQMKKVNAAKYTIVAHGLEHTFNQNKANFTMRKDTHQYPAKSYMLCDKYAMDLDERLKQEPNMSFTYRFCMAIKLALELHKLHTGKLSSSKKNYAHLDLHPKNIMFDTAGRIKFIDFENCSEFNAATVNDRKLLYADGFCVADYLSASCADKRNAIYRDVFALLRVLYIPSGKHHSIFSIKSFPASVPSRKNEFNLYDLLATTNDKLERHQQSSALSLAGRMMAACYPKLRYYQDKVSAQEKELLDTTKVDLCKNLLLEALEIAAINTSDPVKRFFITTMTAELGSYKEYSLNDLKDKLYVIMRNLSRHQAFFKGRWTTKHGLTAAPLAYSSCKDYLLQAAELLDCSRVAKNILYKDKAKLDNNIQANSYAFFAKKYQASQFKQVTTEQSYVAA